MKAKDVQDTIYLYVFLESLHYKHLKQIREQIQLHNYTRECRAKRHDLTRLIFSSTSQTFYNFIISNARAVI